MGAVKFVVIAIIAFGCITGAAILLGLGILWAILGFIG